MCTDTNNSTIWCNYMNLKKWHVDQIEPNVRESNMIYKKLLY